MAPLIIKIGVTIVVQVIGYIPCRYVGDVVERKCKHDITYLDPDGADRDYSKWSWEFWR